MFSKRPNGRESKSAKRSKFTSIPGESENFSLFEHIPKDIACEMIRYVPESVFKLRLTSRIAKSWVDGFSSLRPLQTPLTEKLSLIGSSDPSSPVTISFVIVENANLFDLRLATKPPAEMIQQMARHRITGTRYKYELKIKYYLSLPSASQNEDILDHLSDCLGRKIDNVEILHCDDFIASTLTKLFDGAKLRKMVISSDSISDPASTHLSTIIKNCKVDELLLAVKTISAADPVKLLIDLSSVVRSLYITQHRAFLIGRDNSYFFGASDVDWAPVILKIFAGRMDKLLINSSYPEYLDDNNAEILRNRLPKLGKPIWFDATCITYEEDIDCTKNGHWVRADANSRIESSLRVIHVSRRNETCAMYF